jgi:hypothetical protein
VLRNIVSTVVKICVALLLGACAGYTPSIKLNETPTGQGSYLFGRFFIDSEDAFLGLDGHQAMGFVIMCGEGKRYALRFSNKDALQVIKVSPSTCTFTEIVG